MLAEALLNTTKHRNAITYWVEEKIARNSSSDFYLYMAVREKKLHARIVAWYFLIGSKGGHGIKGSQYEWMGAHER